MKIWRVLGTVQDKTFKLIRPRKEEILGGRVESCFEYGDVIASNKDLSKHNYAGITRFERLPDEVIEEETSEANEEFDDDLGELTVLQLKTRAEELEVDLDGITKKQEIIDFLRLAMA